MGESISIRQVYDKILDIEQNMVKKSELSEYLETFAILSNKDTMRSIKKGREDIRLGKVKKISSVKDLISEIK